MCHLVIKWSWTGAFSASVRLSNPGSVENLTASDTSSSWTTAAILLLVAPQRETRVGRCREIRTSNNRIDVQERFTWSIPVSVAPRSVVQNSRDWFMTLDDSERPSLTLNGTRCSVLVWLNIWLIGACLGEKLIPAHRGKPSHPGDVASPSCSGRISNEVSSLRRKDLEEMNEAIKT